MNEEQLLARLTLVDDMSDKLLDIANAGMDMTSKLEQMSDAANAAFGSVSEQASRSVSAAEELSSAMNGLSSSSMSAASGADYWTSAVGNYDKSALEAVYNTEQLVEMGYKSADALLEQSSVTETLDGAMNALAGEMDSAANSQNELSQAIDNANTMLEDSINAENMSVEAKQELEQASNNAADALKELERAQNEAQAAMENFDSIMNAEVLDATALADAAEQASRSSEALASAQDKANSAVSELSKATEDASKSVDDFGDKSEDSEDSYNKLLSKLTETAVFVEVTRLANEAASAIFGLADAYSEAEKTVVNATGATGEALEGLDQSMMAAFSTHHAELSDTAGAIGEINTRMGYTGEKLTDVTGKFLDFADITGSDVVTSVQNATKIMNKWGIEQDNVVSVLDKLAYEGQVSGASVDSLSSSLINGASSFQAMDLSLDSTISLLGALELQGINSSSVIMGLKTATKNFSADGLDAASALRSTVDQIATMGDEAAATTLAIETFGSKAGVEMASAIRSGAITVEMLNGNLSEAEGTLQKTAQAGETLSEKWEKSSNRVKTAITTALEPSVSKLSEFISDITSDIGEFLEEHQTLTKILSSAGVALGIVTAGFTALTFAVNTAIPELLKFVKTIGAAAMAHPAVAATIAIVALAAGIATLVSSLSDAESEVADYNGTLEECSKEIENTKAAHEKAVQMYGEESDAARQLGAQLDTLNAQYAKGGGVVEDYAQRLNKSKEAFSEFSKNYTDSIKKIDDTATAGFITASQLETLSEKAIKTNTDLDLMSKYADYLNDTFECNIKVNYDTGELTGFDPVGTLQKEIDEKTAEKKRATAIESLSDPDFKTGYVDDLHNLNSVEQEIKQYQKKLANNLEYMSKIKNVDYLKDFASNNPNEKYDYSAIFADLTKDELRGGNQNNPFTDDWGNFFNPWENVSTSNELAQFYNDYKDYEKLLDEKKGYENTLTEKNAKIKDMFDMAGASGGESSYIKDIEKNAFDTGNAINSLSDFIAIYKNGTNDATAAQIDFEKALNATSDSADEAANKFSSEWNRAMEDGELSTSEMVDLINAMPDNVSGAITQFNDELLSIQEEYNAVYEACVQSFEGQFGLFDEAQEKSEATVEAFAAAQQSQLEYWQSYGENIEYFSSLTAEKLGLTQQEFDAFEQGLDVLKERAASGDTEIAGLLDNMKSNLQSTDESNKQAVIDAVTTTGLVADERNKTAEDTARWVDDLDKKMNEAFENAQKSVQQMQTVAPEARAIAMDIMAKYTQGIESGGQTAINRAMSIAAQVRDALNVNASVNYSVNKSGSIEGNAVGTTDSADVFIAGEEGPELIIGKQHSTVFPTSETEKIINAVSGRKAEIPQTFETDNRRFERIINYGDEISNTYNQVTNILDSDAQNIASELASRIESVFIPIFGKTVSTIGKLFDSDAFSFDITLPEVPTSQISDIMLPDKENDGENTIVLPEHRESFGSSNARRDEESAEKHITIDINGGGRIEVSGNMDKESVLEILQENLKPVLMGIIEQEVYEEGDGSYEY